VARILVIDDDRVFRASLRGLLEGAGHAVVAPASGYELRQLRSERFDLAICDLRTPGKEGPDGLDELLWIFPDTPVIATAGRAALGSQAEAAQSERCLRVARERGADHTLLKPFDIEEFLALVRDSVAQPV